MQSGVRALTCDDAPICRKQAKKVLTTCGVEVVDTESGDECLRAYDEAVAAGTPFELIVMDFKLGDGCMNGAECVAALRERGCTCKIIMVTGEDIDESLAKEFQSVGFAHMHGLSKDSSHSKPCLILFRCDNSMHKPLGLNIIRSMVEVNSSYVCFSPKLGAAESPAEAPEEPDDWMSNLE